MFLLTENQQDEGRYSGEQSHDHSTYDSLQSVTSDDVSGSSSKRGSDKVKGDENLQQLAQGYLFGTVLYF